MPADQTAANDTANSVMVTLSDVLSRMSIQQENLSRSTQNLSSGLTDTQNQVELQQQAIRQTQQVAESEIENL